MANIETSRATLKDASIDLLKATGWKPGDKFSFHSVSELMVALAIKVVKGEVGCDYPSCGCCADAACEDAIKQHPDLGGTPPQTNLEPKRWLLEEHLPGGTIRWHCFEHEHQCRARGIISEHEVTVTPLFDHPSPQPREDRL